jgi:hypothetical protein
MPLQSGQGDFSVLCQRHADETSIRRAGDLMDDAA